MKIKYLLVFSPLVILGCATMTPEASSVIVHTQISSLLDDCERLGNVSANTSTFSKWSREVALQQAENDVRDIAYRQYGADTVAIVNSDNFMTSTTVQAIAFKCN